jgi:hypothetical protein
MKEEEFSFGTCTRTSPEASSRRKVGHGDGSAEKEGVVVKLGWEACLVQARYKQFDQIRVVLFWKARGVGYL